MNEAATEPTIEIKAKVFRVAWNRRPTWCPIKTWMWLASKRLPFTGHWEDHGIIASSKDGTAKFIRNP